MAGLPVERLGAVGLQHRIGDEQSRRFHVGDEQRILEPGRDIARQHDADGVGEDLVTLVVNDAATVAVAVEAEPDVGLVLDDRLGDRVQHLHVFGVGIVAREGVVELGVERHHLAADGFQNLRRKCAGRAVAASGDNLQAALQLGPVGQRLHVALGHVGNEDIAAAVRGLISAGQHDLFETRHLVGPEGQRALRAPS